MGQTSQRLQCMIRGLRRRRDDLLLEISCFSSHGFVVHVADHMVKHGGGSVFALGGTGLKQEKDQCST